MKAPRTNKTSPNIAVKVELRVAGDLSIHVAMLTTSIVIPRRTMITEAAFRSLISCRGRAYLSERLSLAESPKNAINSGKLYFTSVHGLDRVR